MGPADEQSTPGLDDTAPVPEFTHCTVRVAVPPPQVAEQADQGDATDQVKPLGQASVLHAATKSTGVRSAQLSEDTTPPDRPLIHRGERHIWPPPQDTEHAEYGV